MQLVFWRRTNPPSNIREGKRRSLKSSAAPNEPIGGCRHSRRAGANERAQDKRTHRTTSTQFAVPQPVTGAHVVQQLIPSSVRFAGSDGTERKEPFVCVL